MLIELLPEGDPFLKQPVPVFRVKADEQEFMQALARDLIETMRDHNAQGLAANQVGLPHRVFVMDGVQPRACFNPELLNEIGEPVAHTEGCLSFPDLELQIKRPPTIQVRYTDEMGRSHTQTMTGIDARCFQHELDHLNGVTFDTRAAKLSLARAKKQRGDRRKKAARGG